MERSRDDPERLQHDTSRPGDGGRAPGVGHLGRREFLTRAGRIVVAVELVSLVPFVAGCDGDDCTASCTSATACTDVCTDAATDCSSYCMGDCTSCTDCTDCTDDCQYSCTDSCTEATTDDCTDYTTCPSECNWDNTSGGGGVCGQCEICLDGCQNVVTGSW
jgi:hypothetical protein